MTTVAYPRSVVFVSRTLTLEATMLTILIEVTPLLSLIAGFGVAFKSVLLPVKKGK